MFSFGADQTFHMRVTCPIVSEVENVVWMMATSFLMGSSSADNGDRHKILDKFDFSAVWTVGLIVTCPLVSHRRGKCCADDSDFILMGKWCLHDRV